MAKKTSKSEKTTTEKLVAKTQSKAPTKKAARAAKPEPLKKGAAKAPVPPITIAPVHNVAPKAEPKKAAKPRARDPRLPAPGTVLQKKDRDGRVRCECTVEEEGIRYQGTVYRSLSAVALAASKDLGLGGRATNGFLFFGLIKQPGRASDPVAALEHAWERYRDRILKLVESAKTDDMPRLQEALENHARSLGGFLQRSASQNSLHTTYRSTPFPARITPRDIECGTRPLCRKRH